MNMLKTTMLLAGLTALFMALGYMLGGSGGAMMTTLPSFLASATSLSHSAELCAEAQDA